MSSDEVPPSSRPAPPRARNAPVLARTVLAIAVCLTGLLWWVSSQQVEELTARRFDARALAIDEAIKGRLVDYEEVLWGGVGMFKASANVTRDEWRAYTSTLALKENRPGIQGFGYAVPLDPNEIDTHEAAMRAEGFPDYGIQPEGVRDEYSAIVYLEPFDWRNQRAFGFDMWSNSVRREAMARARDTGEASSSGMITLVQETDTDVQRGFLMYLPTYEHGAPLTTVEQRRAAHTGWVYAAFRMGDLMAGILGSELGDVAFEIFDGNEVSEAALLFDSDDQFAGATSTPGSSFRTELEILSQGRPWTIVFESTSSFGSTDEARRPTYIAVAALVIELLLFFIISSLHSVQKRASELAEEKTAALRLASRELEGRAKKLQASNDELEQFIYTAAHDLQAPIRTISNYALLIEDDATVDLDPATKETIALISDSAGKMSQLLNDLLRYARIGWNIEAETEQVDLNFVVADVIVEIFGDKASEVEVQLSALPVVTGHPMHLRQLLHNLVDNAVKFAKPDEQLSLRVEAERLGETWVISVTDNGVGFPESAKDRIFLVFQRLPDSEGTEGTGIGLANCRKIARLHGGNAWASSTPGEGSTFYFSLASQARDTATETYSDASQTIGEDLVLAGNTP